MKIIAIVAQTADGFIARDANQFADWTSKEDKKLFVELTRQAGVIIMGSNTFNTIGRALPGRRNIVYTRNQIDAAGIETTTEAPDTLLKRLADEGHKTVAVIGGQKIYNLFFKEQLVTDLYVTYEPILFGQGMSLLGESADIKLKLLEYRTLNANALMAHYKVEYAGSDQ